MAESNAHGHRGAAPPTERPDAIELLNIARRVLREQLLQQLPPQARYAALMVANAMAIAAREVAASGVAPAAADTAALARELGVADGDEAALARAVARALRQRTLGTDDPRLRAWLRQRTVAALRISNPRFLGGHGLA